MTTSQDGRGYLLPDVIPTPGDDICIRVYFPNHPAYRRALIGQLTDLGKWYTWARDPEKRGATVSGRMAIANTRTLAEMDAGTGCTDEPVFTFNLGQVWDFRDNAHAAAFSQPVDPGAVWLETMQYLPGLGWGTGITERPGPFYTRVAVLERTFAARRWLRWCTFQWLIANPPPNPPPQFVFVQFLDGEEQTFLMRVRPRVTLFCAQNEGVGFLDTGFPTLPTWLSVPVTRVRIQIGLGTDLDPQAIQTQLGYIQRFEVLGSSDVPFVW